MSESAEANRMRVIESVSRQLDWYHSIELYPGFFTPGNNPFSQANLITTREMLRRCEVANAICLDVGAMEGLIAAILCRRQARRVIACDRYSRHDQINLVRAALGLNFQYLSNSTLAEVRTLAPKLLDQPFDVIVFSGVLYHMYDPMQGLGILRSLVRTGGIVIVETSAAISDKHIGYFNVRGINSPDPHNYWTVSVALLDYLLRYFRLQPIDAAYLPSTSDEANLQHEDGARHVRVAIACRAVANQIPEEDDTWLHSASGRYDDREYPDWLSANLAEVKYDGTHSQHPVWRSSGALDVYRTMMQSAPIAYNEDMTKLGLTLAS